MKFDSLMGTWNVGHRIWAENKTTKKVVQVSIEPGQQGD